MLSIAIITHNEEKRLPDCLKSLSFADEIVIVDSNSRDRTVEIAKEYGAKVFNEEWQGFGKQKQLAIDHCANKWVLVLDADERIPVETAREIEEILKNSRPSNAYSLPRKNIFMNRWIKHAGWWPDRVVRLINKNSCAMNENLVHESIQVQGKTGELANPIIHYATQNLAHTMEKMDRYSSAGATETFEREDGKASSYQKAFLRAAWAFFYNYFIRLGFLDMGPGFIIAVSDASNKFFKYAKLVEMQQASATDKQKPRIIGPL